MPSGAEARPFPRFGRVRDLTHTLTPEFPTFFGVPGIGMKQIKEFKKDGFNLMEWTVLEHSGTHIDTPIHFSESGAGPDTLAVDDLVVPLAVFNVAAKADAMPTTSSRPPTSGNGNGATAGSRPVAALPCTQDGAGTSAARSSSARTIAASCIFRASIPKPPTCC